MLLIGCKLNLKAMEGINSKETIKQLREDLEKKFIEDKVSSEEFSERQKGLISGWLNEALTLGCALGEKEGLVNSNPEAMDKIIEMITSLFGEKGENTELVKKTLEKSRWIVKGQSQVIGWYDSLVDDLITEKMKPKHESFAWGIGAAM